MLQRKDIVVFDFDGTLSAGDANRDFFKYCLMHSVRPWFYLPRMGAALVGNIFNQDSMWWRENIRKFLTEKMVADFSDDFIKKHLKKRFDWAKKTVAKERTRGNKVVLISAGADFLIEKLVSDIKFDAVLTSIFDKKKPWHYKFLCFGKNKVVAMDKWARENKYIPNVVRAYSDSKSDMPIMSIAKEQIWINRRTGKRK
jgi:HAD superfamily phosphoserine phosphatase-like hydrolase